MADTLSLAWSAHENNICSGLRSLQQQGEFVDMTLAADGHHVKVHQLVLSLASPYIKDLITSAPSSHPIIFLNNISYSTLCAILEYVYTGEAHIPKDSLSELLQTAKALHIKGLKELKTAEDYKAVSNSRNAAKNEVQNEVEPVSKANVNSDDVGNDQSMDLDESEVLKYTPEEEEAEVLEPTTTPVGEKATFEYISMPEVDDTNVTDDEIEPSEPKPEPNEETAALKPAIPGNVQYSMSNHGNLQIIFNRYIYNLKYVKKNLNKYWRCVDYGYRRCPANIYTNNKNEVIQRRSNHTHPFHDQKIMKKLQFKLIFGAISEAEDRILNKKEEENIELQTSAQSEEENITE